MLGELQVSRVVRSRHRLTRSRTEAAVRLCTTDSEPDLKRIFQTRSWTMMRCCSGTRLGTSAGDTMTSATRCDARPHARSTAAISHSAVLAASVFDRLTSHSAVLAASVFGVFDRSYSREAPLTARRFGRRWRQGRGHVRVLCVRSIAQCVRFIAQCISTPRRFGRRWR